MKTRYSESYKDILKISFWWYLGLCCHRGPCLMSLSVVLLWLCLCWCPWPVLPPKAIWMSVLQSEVILMSFSKAAPGGHIDVNGQYASWGHSDAQPVLPGLWCSPQPYLGLWSTTVWVYVDIWLLWSMLPPQAIQISFSMLWSEVMLLSVGQAAATHHTYPNGLHCHLRPWRCPGPRCHQGPYLGPRSYCSLIFADIPGSCCHWKPSRCQWSMLHLEAILMFMVSASESLV